MADDFSTAAESPSSKSIKVSGDRQTGMIVKRMRYNAESPNSWESEIPDIGDEHPYRDDLFFFDADIKPVAGGFADLVLNYSWRRTGVIESQLRNQTADFPLNTHEDYLLRWDHYLIASEAQALPSWWNDAKSIDDIKDEPEYVDKTFQIVTSVNATSEKIIISPRIKPKNTYSKPKKTVIEKIYFAELVKAQQASLSSGLRGQPFQRFGIGTIGNISEWLCTSAPINRDMGFWVVTQTWEFSDSVNTLSEFVNDKPVESVGWDLDIYKSE